MFAALLLRCDDYKWNNDGEFLHFPLYQSYILLYVWSFALSYTLSNALVSPQFVCGRFIYS